MIKSALQYMYQLLITPIEDALKDEDRLTIIPCGELFALPFAALLDSGDEEDEKKQKQYLIEKFVLSFAPSIGTIAGLKRRSDERDKEITNDKSFVATIVGNPDYHGEEVPLEGTEEEAKALCDIIKRDANAAEPFQLCGEDATVSNVMGAMDNSDLIHIAAHGFKDRIRLSNLGDNKDKGFDDMTMMDVQWYSDLKYSKLVVLSCCDTFRGTTCADGMLGITRSFLVAGTSTVVASLWIINDKSTAYMMKQLYTEMFRCPDGEAKDERRLVDVSSALQKTMKQMILDGFDVMEWAPMVVYGLESFSMH